MENLKFWSKHLRFRSEKKHIIWKGRVVVVAVHTKPMVVVREGLWRGGMGTDAMTDDIFYH